MVSLESPFMALSLSHINTLLGTKLDRLDQFTKVILTNRRMHSTGKIESK